MVRGRERGRERERERETEVEKEIGWESRSGNGGIQRSDERWRKKGERRYTHL